VIAWTASIAPVLIYNISPRYHHLLNMKHQKNKNNFKKEYNKKNQ